MQAFLIFALQVFIGLLFFYFFESHKYIVKGLFRWQKWKAENLATFVWSFGIACFIILVMTLDPKSAEFAFKFIGINFAEYGDNFTLSGVVAGLLVGYATKRTMKPKREIKDPGEGAE